MSQWNAVSMVCFVFKTEAYFWIWGHKTQISSTFLRCYHSDLSRLRPHCHPHHTHSRRPLPLRHWRATSCCRFLDEIEVLWLNLIFTFGSLIPAVLAYSLISAREKAQAAAAKAPNVAEDDAAIQQLPDVRGNVLLEQLSLPSAGSTI